MIYFYQRLSGACLIGYKSMKNEIRALLWRVNYHTLFMFKKYKKKRSFSLFLFLFFSNIKNPYSTSHFLHSFNQSTILEVLVFLVFLKFHTQRRKKKNQTLPSLSFPFYYFPICIIFYIISV